MNDRYHKLMVNKIYLYTSVLYTSETSFTHNFLLFITYQDGVTVSSYQNQNSCSNGSDPNVSPGAAAAAAVAAVAQGLRQQMCSMVAAAHNQSTAHDTNPVASLVNSLALAGHCGSMSMPPSNGAPPMVSYSNSASFAR